LPYVHASSAAVKSFFKSKAISVLTRVIDDRCSEPAFQYCTAGVAAPSSSRTEDPSAREAGASQRKQKLTWAYGKGWPWTPLSFTRPTMPNPFTPCRRATPEIAIRPFQGWPIDTGANCVFYPFSTLFAVFYPLGCCTPMKIDNCD
jgi:hypothetical protein